MEMVDTVLGGINLLLGAIAGISLLVGGIGIMNIMLVSVSERTPEIGLRKSIGATNNNILCQFMCEAIVVTLLGGILGIIIGTGMTWLMAIGANYAGFEWEFSISVQAILLGLAMAFSFGLTFGLYPAWKASKLDPIEAMRKE
jgi:putative ABC transport system permease protein